MRTLAIVLFTAMAIGASGCQGRSQQRGAGPAPQQFRGTIVQVLGSEEISALLVRAGSDTYEVRIDPQRDYGFDLDHLRQHLETGEPVKVRSEYRGGYAYAVSIEDG